MTERRRVGFRDMGRDGGARPLRKCVMPGGGVTHMGHPAGSAPRCLVALLCGPCEMAMADQRAVFEACLDVCQEVAAIRSWNR